MPSSPFTRAINNMRGGIASLVIVLTLSSVGLFLTSVHLSSRAVDLDRSAALAMAENKHQAAIDLWSEAADSYAMIYKHNSQAECLAKLSQVFVLKENFRLAAISLMKAHDLVPDGDYDESLSKTRRLWASHKLKESRELLEQDLATQALSKASESIGLLQEGLASVQQIAAANRMTARCHAHLEQFDEAKILLKRAVELEGSTEDNNLASREVEKLKINSKNRRLAESKKQRYIPDKAIEVTAVAASQALPSNTAYQARPLQTTIPRANTYTRPSTDNGNKYPTRQNYPSYQAPIYYGSVPTQNSSYSQAVRAQTPPSYSPPSYTPPASYTQKAKYSPPPNPNRGSTGSPTFSGVQSSPMRTHADYINRR